MATPKNPENYKNREVHELEQNPVYFEADPPIAPAPKNRKLVTETVDVKHQSGTDRADQLKKYGCKSSKKEENKENILLSNN